MIFQTQQCHGDRFWTNSCAVRKKSKLGSSRPSFEWPIFMFLDTSLELLHELGQLIFLNFPCRGHGATGSKITNLSQWQLQ